MESEYCQVLLTLTSHGCAPEVMGKFSEGRYHSPQGGRQGGPEALKVQYSTIVHLKTYQVRTYLDLMVMLTFGICLSPLPPKLLTGDQYHLLIMYPVASICFGQK